MNIGIDIRPLMERHQTGVVVYTYEVLKNILADDRENNYFLFFNSFKKIKHLPAQAGLPKFDCPNVTYCEFRYPNKFFNLAMKFFGWPKVDKLINKKYNTNLDIFWMPNWQFIALSKKIKKILTVHDLSPVLCPEFFSKKRKLWHKFINPAKLCKTFDQLIAVSKNTKNDLVNTLSIPEEKIKVVYSGLNSRPETQNSQLETIKTKYNLPDSFILYLGTLEPRKNIIGIIKAFEKLNSKFLIPNSSLVLAGPRGWLYEDIYRVAKQSPAADKIQFINYVDNKDKFDLYKLAKLFVFPSFYEGFGFPPLEAMSADTPVVASLSSSLGEILKDAALLIDPYNINEIATAIAQILTDEKLKNKLIENGKKLTRKYSWEKCGQEVLEILNR